jgi:protein gp37
MAENSKIEWTDHTFNPWIGCTKVSPGCANCYAEVSTPVRTARAKGHELWGEGSPRQRTSEANWKQPLKWNRDAGRKFDSWNTFRDTLWATDEKLIENGHQPFQRPRVFCASLSDWLDNEVPIEWLADLLKLIHDTPNLDWLLLTKRPENYWIRVPQAMRLIRKLEDERVVEMDVRNTPEKIEAILEYPDYLISNTGRIFGTGSALCLFCGGNVEGSAKKKYCSEKCRTDAHYHGDRFTSVPALMSPDESEDGYQRVTLVRDGIRRRELVHRLVLKQFKGNPPSEAAEGRHRNGNPKLNHIANLEWGEATNNWDDRKRHGNRLSYFKLTDHEAFEIRTSPLDDAELSARYGVSSTQIRNIKEGRQWAEIPTLPENCWVGVTVEDQKRADERIPELLKIPARLRFLSVEPQLEEIQLNLTKPVPIHDDEFGDQHEYYEVNRGIHWCIVGGESGPKRRPFKCDWARSIKAQCEEAGVGYFFKQVDKVQPIPADLMIREFPEVRA